MRPPHVTPEISKGELLDAITSGVLEALRDTLPVISKEEILKAIAGGVFNACRLSTRSAWR